MYEIVDGVLLFHAEEKFHSDEARGPDLHKGSVIALLLCLMTTSSLVCSFLTVQNNFCGDHWDVRGTHLHRLSTNDLLNTIAFRLA